MVMVIMRILIGVVNINKEIKIMSKELDEAREEIVDSMIGLCDFKITIPLSEKTRNIHTDTFVYLEPLDFMSKIDNIYSSLTNKSGVGCRECKLIPYRRGYWYVKGITINYYTEQTMTLTLSPLPTVYRTNYAPKTSATTKKKNTATKNTNVKLKPPSYLSNSDKAWATKTVLQAIGTKTDPLKIAKAIDKAFKRHVYYSYYSNAQKTPNSSNLKGAWNNKHLNCADGANVLQALFKTASLHCNILHCPNHYIVKLTINGHVYKTDCSGATGYHPNKAFGVVYGSGNGYVTAHAQ